MRVAIDASVLAFLFDDAAKAPIGSDGVPISECQARLEHLIAELQQAKATLIVPTPALSEILVYAGEAAPVWLGTLAGLRCVRVAPFDTLAAVECAAMARDRLVHGKPADLTKRKAKFDEQITAIALVERADEILTDDDHIRRLAGGKMRVRGIADLDLPHQDRQIGLNFEQ